MPHETFAGPAIPELLARAASALGPHARVVGLSRLENGGGWTLTAASDLASARVLASPGAWPPPRALTGMTPQLTSFVSRRCGLPACLALVGPTGAGKTTTLAKLANRRDVFGGLAVGLLCLDTYRVGAVEQARLYADLSRLPLEVAWRAEDLPGALRRLRACELVLVDTPGRGPARRGDLAETRTLLRQLAPREVHLALPAGLDPRHARRVLVEHRALGVTHLLPTKLDECPDDTTAFDLALEAALPMRWLADGQEVPDDLRAAWPRVEARAAAPDHEAVTA